MRLYYNGDIKGLKQFLKQQRAEILYRAVNKLEALNFERHRLPLEKMYWGENYPRQFQEKFEKEWEKQERYKKELMMEKCEQNALEEHL